MKNKILSVLAISFVLCTCLLALTACGHTHDFSILKADQDGHWYECTCGEKSVIETHNGGTATCTELAVCSVCGESYGELKEHNHTTLKNNETAHWYECVCGDIDGIEAHKGGTATCTELAKCSVCDESYGELKEHNYAMLKNNETEHWYGCVCGEKSNVENHKDGTATCTELAVCSVCNEGYGELKEHNYAWLKNNETEHWHECVCGDKKNIQNHIPSAEATETTDQKCTVCNYIITPALGHLHILHLTKVNAKLQSCTKEGNIEYYTCDCGKWFTNNTATTEITDKTSVVIEKDEHNHATLKNNETQHWYECICGDKSSVENHKGGTATCTELAVCSVCNESYGELKEHNYATLKNNETEHWYECVCGDKSNIENHKGGTATCTELAVCSVCNAEYGTFKEHNYNTLKHSETQHWNECVCGAKDRIENHNGGTATCTELAKCSVCDESYGELKEHNHTTLKNNETAHWYECVCGAKDSIENHKGGSATCTELAVCSVCNESYGELKEHNYATLKNNETEHWYECICGDIDGIEAHKGGSATCTELAVCSVCNAEYGTFKEHNYDTLKHSETQHWNECVCGAKDSIENHNGGSATCTELAVCSVCNVEYGGYAPHPHESQWTYNETHHWHESTCDCEAKVDFEQHTPDDSGWCRVCEQAVSPTKGIYYEVSAEGTFAEVVAYTGTSTKINIASTYKGLPVTSIYSNVFRGTAITTVVIPNSITSIGSSAFYGCSNLTSVVIGDSVTSIGDYAFTHCTSLTSVVIGDSVTSIGDYAFYNCTSLTSITIPDSVTSIGDWAFYKCTSLTSITIPDGVTSIGSSAFEDCISLTSITIPDSVTSIGDWAFYKCASLASVVIGDSVTSIGDYAFENCSSLTSVTCPAFAISHISKNKLQTVVITSGDAIGSSAFDGCFNLTSVVIGDSVTSIGYYAFYNCTSLTSITIPDSVTSIGSSAFSNCPITKATIPTVAIYHIRNSNLKEVLITSGENIPVYAFYNCTSLTSITIPDSVTHIGDWAFAGCSSLTSVVIGDSVTSISEYAFYVCCNLTSITIPDSVTSIGDSAFRDCSKLTSVVIGDRVTSIGDYAFYACFDLTSVVIGDSVTSIGVEAFHGCIDLTSIKYRGTQAQWSAINKGDYWDSYTGSYTITYNYTDN